MDAQSLDHLDETQLRTLAQSLLQKIAQDSNQIQSPALKLKHNHAYIDALVHEIRLLRHLRFARKSESMDDRQLRLFDEAINEDIAAAEAKLAELTKDQPSSQPRIQPKRQPLPVDLPRVDIHHEPTQTECDCGTAMERVSQDVSERLH